MTTRFNIIFLTFVVSFIVFGEIPAAGMLERPQTDATRQLIKNVILPKRHLMAELLLDLRGTGHLRLINLVNGQILDEKSLPDEGVIPASLVASPDEKHLAFAIALHRHPKILMIELDRRRIGEARAVASNSYTELAFSPDSRQLFGRSGIGTTIALLH